jgi:hypothetical protein
LSSVRPERHPLLDTGALLQPACGTHAGEVT